MEIPEPRNRLTKIEAVSVSGGLGRHALSMSAIAAVQFPGVVGQGITQRAGERAGFMCERIMVKRTRHGSPSASKQCRR